MNGQVEITVVTSDDRWVVYVGQVVCRMPSSVAVLLTEPFSAAGRIVEIPVEDIISERPLADSRPSR